MRCGFCDNLTLLYPPGAAHPVLGLGRPAAPRRYLLVSRPRGCLVQLEGWPKTLVPRIIVATMLAPVIGGAIVFAAMLSLAFTWERYPAYAAAGTVLGGLLLAFGLGWYGVAAVLRKPAVQVDPRGVAQVIRPLPVPAWPGRRKLAGDEVAQVRVETYLGASQRGVYRKLSEQMSRSGDVRVEALAASLVGDAGAVELTRVVAAPRRGRPLVIAEGIEHPTEGFELAEAARRALGVEPATMEV